MGKKKGDTTPTEALEYIEGMNLVDCALYIVLADAKAKDLKERLTDGREKLRVATRDLNGLREAVACLRNSLGKNRKERKRLAGDVQKAEAALATARQDKKDLQVTVENVVADRDALKARVQTERQAGVALHHQGERTLDREALLRGRLVEYEESMEDMKADRDYAENQVAELKEESAEWERLYHCQTQETRSLRAELRRSRDAWLKADVELMNLKMDIQDGNA